jgi:FkbM family methyltransferase
MIVIDVGASDGEFSSFIVTNHLNCMVYAIEPNPVSAKKIERNSRIQVRPLAIGLVEKAGIANLHISMNPELSSIIEANAQLNREVWSNHLESLTHVGTIEVPILSLEMFMTSEGISEVDFLKIDAQGQDWQVFLSAFHLISKIKVLAMEVSYETSLALYANEQGMSQIVQGLDSKGFTVAWVVPNGGAEANLIAYNRNYGFEAYLEILEDLNLKNAPSLKLDLSPRLGITSTLRRRLWFLERRYKLLKSRVIG